MDEENKFYRSKLYSLRYIIPTIIVLLLVLYVINKHYTFYDTIIFIVLFSFVCPVVILCIIGFIYWLISLKNAKKSYMELSTQFMIINNYYGFFKIKEEFNKIKYDDIKEIKIFFDLQYYCYNVNIHKKWDVWKHDAIFFELKMSDYTRFTEMLNLYWVNFSKHSYF